MCGTLVSRPLGAGPSVSGRLRRTSSAMARLPLLQAGSDLDTQYARSSPSSPPSGHDTYEPPASQEPPWRPKAALRIGTYISQPGPVLSDSCCAAKRRAVSGQAVAMESPHVGRLAHLLTVHLSGAVPIRVRTMPRRDEVAAGEHQPQDEREDHPPFGAADTDRL